MQKFYKFNEEFLEKIINIEDLIIHSDNNIYKNETTQFPLDRRK